MKKIIILKTTLIFTVLFHSCSKTPIVGTTPTIITPNFYIDGNSFSTTSKSYGSIKSGYYFSISHNFFDTLNSAAISFYYDTTKKQTYFEYANYRRNGIITRLAPYRQGQAFGYRYTIDPNIKKLPNGKILVNDTFEVWSHETSPNYRIVPIIVNDTF